MMLKSYYLNTEPQNNNYEVHSEECKYLPSFSNREFLGVFYNCSEAVNEAKRLHPTLKIDGCFFCSIECHHF
ncbi:hypothetical protein B4W74_00405 [Staphylococcus intermedius]|nr:hypothetical protein B5C04_00405 [Staphylococcus intermedius]PCF74743.1 hypothetical protein B4W72_02785 [Staphylococcus delphini]PCF77652.1 hypothetical protein B4W69_13955 [Staphylococcus delphini]PCF79307.1 hypothetical protein B4W69_13160 [Staphylococcus delphini]PCF81386.1 hypothetical protein B4W74_00405 [Staphylococcus intermedius]